MLRHAPVAGDVDAHARDGESCSHRFLCFPCTGGCAARCTDPSPRIPSRLVHEVCQIAILILVPGDEIERRLLLPARRRLDTWSVKPDEVVARGPPARWIVSASTWVCPQSEGPPVGAHRPPKGAVQVASISAKTGWSSNWSDSAPPWSSIRGPTAGLTTPGGRALTRVVVRFRSCGTFSAGSERQGCCAAVACRHVSFAGAFCHTTTANPR